MKPSEPTGFFFRIFGIFEFDFLIVTGLLKLLFISDHCIKLFVSYCVLQ